MDMIETCALCGTFCASALEIQTQRRKDFTQRTLFPNSIPYV